MSRGEGEDKRVEKTRRLEELEQEKGLWDRETGGVLVGV